MNKRIIIFSVLLLIIVVFIISDMNDQKSIEQVLKENQDKLMAIEGVFGVSIGNADGAPCIQVQVTNLTLDLSKNIPDSIDGYQVEIFEMDQPSITD